MKNLITLLFVAAISLSCQYETLTVADVIGEELNDPIAGSWLYVEYGYSPGGGYYTVPVPAVPPKTITFNEDYTMSSIDMGLEKYKYYRLLQDTVIDRQVIAFFEKYPGVGPIDLDGLSPTYYTFFEGDYLSLSYRWCTEGCHEKFKRISPVELE